MSDNSDTIILEAPEVGDPDFIAKLQEIHKQIPEFPFDMLRVMVEAIQEENPEAQIPIEYKEEMGFPRGVMSDLFEKFVVSWEDNGQSITETKTADDLRKPPQYPNLQKDDMVSFKHPITKEECLGVVKDIHYLGHVFEVYHNSENIIIFEDWITTIHT